MPNTIWPQASFFSETGSGGADTSAKASAPATENMDTIEYPEEDINPEDIPF